MISLPQTPLIAVVGPTGSGKTDLAEQLAREFNGELINADSRQFYRGLSIGTAKPSGKSQPDGTYLADSDALYHLVDIRDPDEPMNLAQFQALAREAWDEIASRDKLPILVGGTGLYVEAAVTDLVLDGSSAEKRPFPRLLIPPNVLILSPTRSDEELRARIRKRTDAMFTQGLAEEIAKLMSLDPDLPALSSIGYREILSVLKGDLSEKEARDEINSQTWQLARRQRTWWRRRPEVRPVSSNQEAVNLVRTHLKLY